MDTLLILEDDLQTQEVLMQGLSSAFSIFLTSSAEAAMAIALEKGPDAALIDMNITRAEQLQLCVDLRSNARTRMIPILVMSGDQSQESMALAYSHDIDDYLAKPISLKEAELRIKARIRRLREVMTIQPLIGNLVLYADRKEIQIDGKSIHLPPLEFQLLQIFLQNPGRLISRDEILAQVWKKAAVSLRTVDVHISSLRRKLCGFSHSIQSVYGSGYILRQNETLELESREG